MQHKYAAMNHAAKAAFRMQWATGKLEEPRLFLV
jgi:hypothetical protein